ncbi:thioredoxin family protein [Maribacter sp. MAR_2009_72]|uniref:thioredoxin family protein n=1 Tax=Maribacter sp. MAR_2009_72 TaxID=1250050 RepID=UPI00119936B7|nr:thioredoxin family protein [Maribacter sp. MAR_2009_72]TVZ15770.1 thioredoxin-like protein [Maribacter sp. MAR_2009_72]
MVTINVLNKDNMELAVEDLIEKSLINGYTYGAYRALVAGLAEKGATTGPEQTEAFVQYTRLNDSRMRRWDKTLRFSDEDIAKIKSVDQPVSWLVLTESWCGDASPALPVMHKITEINPKVSLTIILRDMNLAIMDRFLTNGTRSIPKLVAINQNSGVPVATWGPRSMKATVMVEKYKNTHGKLTPEFKQDLQLFYNKDKGQSILEDLLRLLPLK